METTTSTGNRNRTRQWLIIAAIAIAVHLVLLLTVREEFFHIFEKSVSDNAGASSPRASRPQAIVVVPVEVESDQGEVAIKEPQEKPPTEKPSQDQRQGEPVDAASILEVVGQSQAPIPSSPTSASAIVPPRPVEITWPDTGKLGHCLGLHIDIRIRVGADGDILDVAPVDTSHPPDCTRAALDAARRIRFRPGTVDGKVKTMWTQIRIEFRRQKR
jgi:TonB family protein